MGIRLRCRAISVITPIQEQVPSKLRQPTAREPIHKLSAVHSRMRSNSGNRIREFDRIREWTADSLCIGSRAVGCLNFDGTCSWIGVITEIARQRKRIPIFAIAGSSLEIVKLASADHID